MLNAAIIKRAGPAWGQVTLSTGSGSWTCPAGVTSVCVVLVGEGGDGIQYGATNSGAGGGALAYKNSIAVVPGQSYAYNVGQGAATTMFGISAGRGANGTSTSNPSSGGNASGGDANFSGGSGQVSFGGTQKGGGAGSYTANGVSGSAGTPTGIGLNGAGSTGAYGLGGTSAYSSGRTYGGAGAIRIIWGVGRSYPNKAT